MIEKFRSRELGRVYYRFDSQSLQWEGHWVTESKQNSLFLNCINYYLPRT